MSVLWYVYPNFILLCFFPNRLAWGYRLRPRYFYSCRNLLFSGLLSLLDLIFGSGKINYSAHHYLEGYQLLLLLLSQGLSSRPPGRRRSPWETLYIYTQTYVHMHWASSFTCRTTGIFVQDCYSFTGPHIPYQMVYYI